MRGVLTLLTGIALLAVLLVGFLVMQRQGDNSIISHNFQRVIPSTSDPDGDRVAQMPMATPAPMAVPPAQVTPDTVQSTHPATTQPYTPPTVNTIDASAPLAATPTPAQPSTSNNGAATTNQPYAAVPSTPSTSSSVPATPTPSKQTPATPAQTDTAAKFDSNGIATLTKDMHKNGYHDHHPAVVVVDKGSHFTYVLQNQDGKIVIVYRASNAVGAADTPSPPGPYKVADIQKYPVWTPPKSIDKEQKKVKPFNVDRKNPLGVEIIRLNKFGVALHGTNNPSSIRSDASHGCVRHSNDDIQKIASMVRVGTTVIVTDKFVGTKISKDMFGSR